MPNKYKFILTEVITNRAVLRVEANTYDEADEILTREFDNLVWNKIDHEIETEVSCEGE